MGWTYVLLLLIHHLPNIPSQTHSSSFLFASRRQTIPYTAIDFTEPPDGNPLLEQDAQDDYFDDEEEFDYRAAARGGDGDLNGDKAQEGEEGKLADGEYDY